VVIVGDPTKVLGDDRRKDDARYFGGDRRGRGDVVRIADKGGDSPSSVALSDGGVIARDSFDGRPPARRGAATSASTVRISASDGGVRLRSRSHFTISPDPMVAGSRTWNSAKYASRIAAWLSVK